MLSSILPMFSSKSFIVSGLIFMSLIHFGFMFVYSVRKDHFTFFFFLETGPLILFYDFAKYLLK